MKMYYVTIGILVPLFIKYSSPLYLIIAENAVMSLSQIDSQAKSQTKHPKNQTNKQKKYIPS